MYDAPRCSRIGLCGAYIFPRLAPSLRLGLPQVDPLAWDARWYEAHVLQTHTHTHTHTNKQTQTLTTDHGFKHQPRAQSGRTNCHPYRGNITLRMSNFDHRPWIQTPTAGPVWADQLSSLPGEYHTLHVKL